MLHLLWEGPRRVWLPRREAGPLSQLHSLCWRGLWRQALWSGQSGGDFPGFMTLPPEFPTAYPSPSRPHAALVLSPQLGYLPIWRTCLKADGGSSSCQTTWPQPSLDPTQLPLLSPAPGFAHSESLLSRLTPSWGHFSLVLASEYSN